MVGGFFGLVGAIILKPRDTRFNYCCETNMFLENDIDNEHLFIPPYPDMISLGTFILWFGWYGFNCGSVLEIYGDSSVLAALIAVNTTLAAASGGITGYILNYYNHGDINYVSVANGILSGLVGITAGCDCVSTNSAILIGIISG